MSDTIIQVENLSKKYILGHQQEGSSSYQSLRETIANGVGSLFKAREARAAQEEFWALKDVSFEIKQGDRVGIIGRNGAGKSTLLKVLSRITEPTDGSIRIKGRVASLLEVGTGFHPELTGRENIYLNGAILGMSKAEIQRKFDEIVTFAEVERFLDTPVKRYSSGMYVRLAFAVAAHLEPEVLVVDEVLAVGDAQFQKKCLSKMGEVAQGGRTVLFVSHNMAAIRALCTTALVLNKGELICAGTVADCIRSYEDYNSQERGSIWICSQFKQDNKLSFTKIVATLNGEQPYLLLELEVHLQSREKHKPAFLAVDILDRSGTAIMQALPTLQKFLSHEKGEHHVKIEIQLPPLIPGQYLVTAWAGSHNSETFDLVQEAVIFEVDESPTKGRSFPHGSDHGCIVPISKLQYRDRLLLSENSLACN